jgi:superfamily II DNA or RNA helicase
VPRYAPIDATGAEDRTVFPDSPGLPLVDLVLRDYQREALESWMQADRQGVIVAPCGAGKTMIGVAAVSSVDSPSLILCHTTEIQRQWIERIERHLRVKPVVVGGKAREGGDPRVCVAMLQTLAGLPWPAMQAFGRNYGLTILDECHHAPAPVFAAILAACAGRCRLGLTATPERADGLGEWVEWCCGPVVAAIPLARLEAAGAVVRPEIRRVQTGWEIGRASCRERV